MKWEGKHNHFAPSEEESSVEQEQISYREETRSSDDALRRRLFENEQPHSRGPRKPERGGKLRRLFRKRWVKVLAIVIGVVIVLAIAGVIALNAALGLNEVKQVKLDETDLGIVEEEIKDEVEEEKLKSIVNIALFGIDTTEGAATIGDQYRSDCIIICSIDPLENKLKMTSILRDSKVPIEGHDPQKINAAYKYGGPQLAVKTLNQNFKTNIRDYVTVDFAHMAEIIDLVGGLTLEITDAEAQNMMQNNVIKPVKAGKHHLDGAQCVAYARVRKIDSDYFRAGRQHIVLTHLFNKIKKKPKSEYPALIKSFLKCVQTSLSYNDILKFARSLDLSSAEIVKNTIPDPRYEVNLSGGTDSTGSWVWTYDLDKAAERLRKIIYGGFKPDETIAPGNYSNSGSSSNSSSSSSSGSGNQETTTYYEPETTTVPSEGIEEPTFNPEETTESPTDPTEEQPSFVIEDPTEQQTDPPPEQPTDPPPEQPTDPPPEQPTDPPPEQPTDPPPEQPTDPPPEQPTGDSGSGEGDQSLSISSNDFGETGE